MKIPVRTFNPYSNLLFEWDAENNLVEIVHKNEKIKIQLIKNGSNSSYKILERKKHKK